MAAICELCKTEMVKGGSCLEGKLIQYSDGKELPAVSHTKEDSEIYDFDHCPDCNVTPGKNHHQNCDREKCPRCDSNLFVCDCENQ